MCFVLLYSSLLVSLPVLNPNNLRNKGDGSERKGSNKNLGCLFHLSNRLTFRLEWDGSRDDRLEVKTSHTDHSKTSVLDLRVAATGQFSFRLALGEAQWVVKAGNVVLYSVEEVRWKGQLCELRSN